MLAESNREQLAEHQYGLKCCNLSVTRQSRREGFKLRENPLILATSHPVGYAASIHTLSTHLNSHATRNTTVSNETPLYFIQRKTVSFLPENDEMQSPNIGCIHLCDSATSTSCLETRPTTSTQPLPLPPRVPCFPWVPPLPAHRCLAVQSFSDQEASKGG